MRWILGLCIVLGMSADIHARGFWTQFFSAQQLGMAGASMTVTRHADVAATNPAGMSYLEQGHHVGVSNTTLSGTSFWEGKNSSQQEAHAHSDKDPKLFTPGAQWVYVTDSNWAYGVTSKAPFNSSSRWGDDFEGSELAIESSVTTVGINPSLSYKINDQHSFGVGVGLYELGLGSKKNLALNAGTVDYEDSGTGWNYNLSYLGGFNQWFVALHYSSPIEARLSDGKIDFTLSDSSPTPPGSLNDTNVETEYNLPWTFEFSLGWKDNVANPVWELELGGYYLGWSMYDDVKLKLDTTSPLLSQTPFSNADGSQLTYPQGYRDIVNYRVGGLYHMSEKLKLMAGMGKAFSSVRSRYANPAASMGGFTSVSVGGEFMVSEKASIGVAYNHAEFDVIRSSKAYYNVGFPPFQRPFNGKYWGFSDVLSVSYYQSL